MNGIETIIRVPLDHILVENRLRAVDPDHAALIAESFRANGQMTPIEVRPAGEPGRYLLVAGAHRLEAANVAGFETIAAVVVEASQAEARLREIDENLCRRELSELDRAAFLAERQAIWNELYPETAKRGRRAKGELAQHAAPIPTFTKEVAEKLGLARRTVEAALRRHKAIIPEVRLMLATTRFADSGRELDKIAAQAPEMQRDIAKRLLRDENPCRTVSAAIFEIAGAARAPQRDEADRQYEALLGAWRKASHRAARDRFIRFLAGEGEIEALKAEAA